MSTNKKWSKQTQSECSIIPLGGLGEIGKNMMVIECQDEIIVIDAGLAFPGEDQPGIDLIVPDISYLIENQEKIQAIILTHGHEDHIGALPYVLKQLTKPVPIYGTKMTLGMVANKLEEHHLMDEQTLHQIDAGQKITLGVFNLEFIRVAHSIVDGIAMGIETPAGRIFHTGDFKIDPTPVDGEITDLATFGLWGKQGVDLLLADSTNVEREGYTLSEKEVGIAFDEIIATAKGRVVIACFSSNIHRFQQIIQAALKHQRKIGVLGMSMVKNMRTAQELDYLNIPANLWLKWSDLALLPPEKTVVMTTGSQGEPQSALARAAVGENNDLSLLPSDTVVISARTIPGNEKRISAMINQLFKIGCQVHYERVSEIHVSGHAAREELKIVHNLIKPTYFVPVHGETRHLVHHAVLAEELGCQKENIFVMENGQHLCLTRDRAFLKEAVPAGKVLVDGKGVGDVDQVVLRDRKHLAQDGMVLIIIGVDRQTGEVLAGPEIMTRGLSDENEMQTIREETTTIIREILSYNRKVSMAEPLFIQDKCRQELKKYFKKKMKRFPMIIPVVMEV